MSFKLNAKKNDIKCFHCSKRVRLSPFPWLSHLIYVKQGFLCVSHNKLQCVQDTFYLHTVVKYCCHSSRGSERYFTAVTEHSSVQKANTWDVHSHCWGRAVIFDISWVTLSFKDYWWVMSENFFINNSAATNIIFYLQVTQGHLT